MRSPCHHERQCYTAVNQSINPSINQSINQPIKQSINPSINQSINRIPTQSINQLISPVTLQVYPINQSIDRLIAISKWVSFSVWKLLFQGRWISVNWCLRNSVDENWRTEIQLQGVYLTFERLWNLTRETFAPVWSLSKVFMLRNLVWEFFTKNLIWK